MRNPVGGKTPMLEPILSLVGQNKPVRELFPVTEPAMKYIYEHYCKGQTFFFVSHNFEYFYALSKSVESFAHCKFMPRDVQNRRKDCPTFHWSENDARNCCSGFT